MNAIEAIINKYYEVQPKFTIIKKKKGIYIIKDGIMEYNVIINPLKCPCSSNGLCNHTLFVLHHKIGLNLNIVKFIHKLSNFYELLGTNQMNSELLKTIRTTILNDDCGICTFHIGGIEPNSLHECTGCGKFVHRKCLNKWLTTKKTNETKTCIYCHSVDY